MILLSEIAEKLATELARANVLAIGLDYDGTLTHIRPTPAEAVPTAEARHVLRKLRAAERIELLLITGRSPKDLAAIIGIEDIEIVGNHGLSRLCGGNLTHHQDAKAFFEIKDAVKSHLEEILDSIGCLRLEDKGPGLAIHYRQCPEERHSVVRRMLVSECRNLSESLAVTVREGKKVVELVPLTEVNKGTTMIDWVSGLRRNQAGKHIGIVFAGDDITDENVFSSADDDWVTIQVGEPDGWDSTAKYLASRPDELIWFLYLLLQRLSTDEN